MRDELRILQITLNNYRQYYGNVVVKFTPKKDVFSILVGANGAGKSNLWNAVHWCLFGTEPHLKSSDKPPIINKKYLQEDNDGPFETYVEIIIVTGNDKYLIKRNLVGVLHGLEKDENGMMIMSDEDPVPSGFEVINRNKSELFQESKNGGKWETLNDTHDFKNLVNEKIIPANLAKFFIFDGEFLQDLFSEFGTIKTGIDQISQINILNNTIEFTDNVKFTSGLRGSGKINEIKEKIQEYDQKLASEDRRGMSLISNTALIYGTDDYIHQKGNPCKRDLDKSIANIDKRLHELDKMIDNSNAKSKEEIKNDYASKSKEKKLAETELETVTKYHINSLIINGPLIMCKTSLDSATGLITTEMDKGNLPNASKRMLVGDLLAKSKCLCGTSLGEGTDARKHVKYEMDLITDEVQYDIANDIRYNNEQFMNGYTDMVKRLDDEMKNIQVKKARLTLLREELQDLKLRLPTTDTDYASWISESDQLHEQRNTQYKALGSTESDITRWNFDKADEIRKLNIEQTRTSDENKMILLVQKSDIVRNTLYAIKKDVDQTIRDNVATETLRIYNNMSWKKNYKHLRINDRYQISIMGDDGVNIVGGMAAGEKLFLALSFIMALKNITNYRFPFVIDSPLGKTGGNLRINFGKYMPELLDGTQLIMLATNTEYSNDKIQPDDESEATHTLRELLEQKGSVNEYEINFDKEAETAKIVAGRRI